MDAKINYPDLNALLAKQCNINLSKSENFTRHFFNIIIEGLQKDGIVKINGLGTFKMIDVAGRSSVDVNTGEKIEIKEHRKLTFIPSDTLKDKVNQPFAMFEPFEVSDDYVDEEDNSEHQPEHQPELQLEQQLEQQPEHQPEQQPEHQSEQQETPPQIVEDTHDESPSIPQEPALETPRQESSAHDTKSTETCASGEPAFPNEQPVTESFQSTVTSPAEKKNNTAKYITYTLLSIIIVTAGVYFGFFFAKDAETSLHEAKPRVASQESRQQLPPVVKDEPTDTIKQKAITPQGAEPSSDKEEPFVMLDELIATHLSSITLGDTLLYVANGNSVLHRVGADETLTKISLKYYGDKRLWPYIVHHNKMSNYNQLEIGMQLAIPRLIPREKN
ncbi:MAG: HU family DNA-binding protein [Bacteroidaceae bacterium]|nr:HU family DNA-binding protein [Bacteroidaceae bacterium]